MTVRSQAKCLPNIAKANPKVPVIGVFAPCDPRIDEQSRTRAQNIVSLVAGDISGKVVLPGNVPVPVVYSAVLVDSESQADIVAQQFRQAGVDILVCVPDTWAFPQLTTISLLQQFPDNTPLNITCGNSGPKPGVVYAQALNGALSQSGRMVHLNVGTWPDTGLKPKMTEKTVEDLIDWCYAAVTAVALRGRRVMIFGHDSMGMETALAHILPTRNTFGLEITRLDMKLLADMLAKQAYDKKELKKLRGWIDKYIGDRLELKSDEDSLRFDQSLAMYLINRDLMTQLNAVGGGFMSQLEWGSDLRGRPLPVADCMESLFNSSFDHNGKKPPLPFATEADMQALLTMLFMTYLSGGNPPLFMDFRKVWEGWEIKQLAEEIGVTDLPDDADWLKKGLVDGNNSGSASFDWAAMPGAGVKEIMSRISMPLADAEYFPGGGNSATFMTPAGIEGIAGRRDNLSIDAVRLVDAFLTELDGFKKTKGLIVMGATNSPWAIDPALRRSERFTKQIFIPPPNTEARMQIFQIHCKETPIGPDIDFDALAKVTENYASSDIKTICHTAASIPWEEALKGAAQRKVGMDDFVRAIAKTKSSLTPWITMAKRELEKSGETDVYKDLYKFLSNYRSCTAEEYKEIVKHEKEDIETKKEDDLKFLEIRRTEVADKIKMAQHKYYKRELSPDNFRDIISDYEKQLIELDLQITKMKRAATPNKTDKIQPHAEDKKPQED